MSHWISISAPKEMVVLAFLFSNKTLSLKSFSPMTAYKTGFTWRYIFNRQNSEIVRYPPRLKKAQEIKEKQHWISCLPFERSSK